MNTLEEYAYLKGKQIVRKHCEAGETISWMGKLFYKGSSTYEKISKGNDELEKEIMMKLGETLKSGIVTQTIKNHGKPNERKDKKNWKQMSKEELKELLKE